MTSNCNGLVPYCPNQNLFLDAWISEYNGIVFSNFNGNTGDVEGRLLVGNNCNLGDGFSIGCGVYLDSSTKYALMVGNNLNWGSGALCPDGSGIPFPNTIEEFMFVGGTPTLPSYLSSRLLGLNCTNCFPTTVSNIKSEVIVLQALISALPSNVQYTIQGSGLFLHCNNPNQATYIVEIDESLQDITWFSIVNDSCQLNSYWIVQMGGNSNVLLQGNPALPTSAEKTIFNIQGKNRNVTIITEIGGSIISPQNNIFQTGGVIIGKAIVGNFNAFLQLNELNCKVPTQVVTIIDYTCQDSHQGDDKIYTTSGSYCSPGNVVQIDGHNCNYTIKSKEKQPNGNTCVTLNEPLIKDCATSTRVTINANINNVFIPPSETVSSGNKKNIFAIMFIIIFYVLFV
jgi:choice-of-anchor A domain-containing protein